MDKQEFIQKMKDQPFSVLAPKSIPSAYQKNWASVGLPYALLWSVLWSKNWWSR